MDERDVEITRKCNKFADFQGIIARVIPKFSADFWVRINEVLGYSMLILGLDLDTSVYWGMLLSYFMVCLFIQIEQILKSLLTAIANCEI